MQLNFNNYNNRRLIKGSRSWYLMSSNEGCSIDLHSLLHLSVNATPRVKKNSRKVYLRTFRNSKLCRQFMSKLHKRYSKRFKKPLNFRINLRGNKIEYYADKKI